MKIYGLNGKLIQDNQLSTLSSRVNRAKKVTDSSQKESKPSSRKDNFRGAF